MHRCRCRLRASQINGCGYRTDMHTKEAAAAGETAVRLNLVAAWREATVFTEDASSIEVRIRARLKPLDFYSPSGGRTLRVPKRWPPKTSPLQ
ncbi:MAG: alkylhydroperoxidase [Mycobacterium sp.]|nr:alkylhydroperoxidase [Mycobacterium sp.]